ncbi:conserved hypothetical protein [Leishmania mexicana MHOM/GT/2001/U1103]|uniref:Uncharacterized protein n=1 Tax=Leishmania mexicana (strain MHOM/GT/2001/U1103) TaxID=929439 RepID=E9B586_LEIMU|nr:conserved hypothetical protein [Leishmania mexicana MHOM/GT/2001/U1103]CBZ30406.1 conserved hypothetical protein [Leishmania mexicana MHOM/GT/2001/U1103]
MYSEVEPVSLVDQQFPDGTNDEEDDRVRHSECVNMNVVALHDMLRHLGCAGDCGGQGAQSASGGFTSSSASCLPPEMVDALLHYLVRLQEDVRQLDARAQLLDEQRARDTKKAELLNERTERLKDAVASMSAKSSAEMKEFRDYLQQHASASKQRQRELVDLTRKREKLELEVKRTRMEMDRLRKIAKRVR